MISDATDALTELQKESRNLTRIKPKKPIDVFYESDFDEVISFCVSANSTIDVSHESDFDGIVS